MLKPAKRYLRIFQSLILALLPGMGGSAEPTTYEGQVKQVVDGDTLVLQSWWKKVRVRLAEIDAPEHDQPYGAAAKSALADLVNGRTVRVVSVNHDRYGRVVGRVYVGDTDVNAVLVQQGHAWVYRQYARDKSLFSAEKEAKRARRGLWSENQPTPPWEWRARQRNRL
ncbi:micrococcal nuclease [Gammaproteobacteria bacterium]